MRLFFLDFSWHWNRHSPISQKIKISGLDLALVSLNLLTWVEDPVLQLLHRGSQTLRGQHHDNQPCNWWRWCRQLIWSKCSSSKFSFLILLLIRNSWNLFADNRQGSVLRRALKVALEFLSLSTFLAEAIWLLALSQFWASDVHRVKLMLLFNLTKLCPHAFTKIINWHQPLHWTSVQWLAQKIRYRV